MSKRSELPTVSSNRVWFENKLPIFFTKAREMLHHDKDKDILRHLKDHVSSPESVYSETIQILESGRFDVKQAMDLLVVALEPEQITRMYRSSGQQFFGRTKR